MQKKNVLITKASGESELFSESKLRHSLQRVHAPSILMDEIVAQIETELSEGMSTSEIYRKAFSLLRKKARPVAARYSLRSALMELGPTGRPFERYVGELMKAEGFEVEVAKIVPGVCVKHEVDVVGTKGDRHVMVECKFHNQAGLRSDVKISLYVQARFEDVERQWKKQPHHGEKFHEVWLVTNTKLTSDATDYAKCVGMHAIGWNYPATGSLEKLIEQHKLHPLTCLTRLNRLQKQELLREGLILCSDLLKDRDTLQKVVGTSARVDEIVQEAKELLKII